MRTNMGRAALTISSSPTPCPVQSWNIQPLFRICLRSSMATTENAPSTTCKLSAFSSSLTQTGELFFPAAAHMGRGNGLSGCPHGGPTSATGAPARGTLLTASRRGIGAFGFRTRL